MESEDAILALAALAQPTRLDVFSLLDQARAGGARGRRHRQGARDPAKHHVLASFDPVARGAGVGAAIWPFDHLSGRTDPPAGRRAVHAQGLLRRPARDLRAADRRPRAVLPAESEEQGPERKGPCLSVSTTFFFLCTGNTARSIMAESILRKDGRLHFRAFSAGSQPKDRQSVCDQGSRQSRLSPEKFTLEELGRIRATRCAEDGFRFHSLRQRGGRALSVWPGQPMTAHWGIQDPAEVEGTDLEKEKAFVAVFRYL